MVAEETTSATSEWHHRAAESQHFGVRIARVTPQTAATVWPLLQACRDAGVELAVMRAPTDRLDLVQAAESMGARIMDVLVYLSADFDRSPPRPAASPTFSLGRFEVSDRDGVLAVTRDAFCDYVGHYHADPRIPRQLADQMYENWARDCCDGRYGPVDIFVARDSGNRVAGFVAVELLSEDTANLAIGGMAAWAQGRGGYRDLMHYANAWFRDHRGVRRAEYSTQVSNIAAQRAVMSLGYVPDHAAITLHAWLQP